ncbi:MAG: acetyl-CoA carboxylase biotin carboxyl carrier protein [Leptolyngbyaceae cyanobacterium SM2_5_2]|nr:acetyl-CoA carboxylase biotin carboxyl carrier protein [Leptolyngbyaceae cyanobacterium SM2_5_2]
MELTANELKDLVAALSQSDIAELTLKSSTFELTLRKQGVLGAMPMAVAALAEDPVAVSSKSPEGSNLVAAPTAPAVAPVPPPGKSPELLTISSPMVGTFYRSPAPDEPAFVNVGDRITSGQTVCIIEAMKLMNELEAEISGEVVEILVNNAEPVEFGQALMLVRPT